MTVTCPRCESTEVDDVGERELVVCTRCKLEWSPSSRAPLMDDWTKPQESYRTDGCPKCGGSQAPRFVEAQVATPSYEGRLVLLVYVAFGRAPKMAINGTVFDWSEIGDAKAHADELLGAEHAGPIMMQLLAQIEGCGCELQPN